MALFSVLFIYMDKIQNAAFVSVNPNDVDHLAEASGMYVSVYLA